MALFDVITGKPLTLPKARSLSCKRRYLPALTVLFLLHADSLLAQSISSSPLSTNPVAIENTNASYIATDVVIPQANPARPTVTIPAHIPPTGFLQFEQGSVRAGNSPAGTQGQFAFSQVTKLALTTRLLVQFLTEPYAYSTLASPGYPYTHSSDPGDLQIGVQTVVHKAVGALPTVSLGFIRRVRSGTSASLDAGAYSQSALVLLGGDLPKGFHYDSNILFSEQNTGPVRRAQFGQTLAVTHPLFAAATKQRLSGIVEVSHFTQPFLNATSSGVPVTHANAYDLLFAGTYALRPNLIFDASVVRGFTTTSTHWQGGAGVSYIVPHRLWHDRHPVPIHVGSGS